MLGLLSISLIFAFINGIRDSGHVLIIQSVMELSISFQLRLFGL